MKKVVKYCLNMLIELIGRNLNNKNKGIKNHTPTDEGLILPLF